MAPVGLARPSLRSGRWAVQVRSARRLVIATKAAMGAADPAGSTTMATDREDHDFDSIRQDPRFRQLLREFENR